MYLVQLIQIILLRAQILCKEAPMNGLAFASADHSVHSPEREIKATVCLIKRV